MGKDEKMFSPEDRHVFLPFYLADLFHPSHPVAAVPSAKYKEICAVTQLCIGRIKFDFCTLKRMQGGSFRAWSDFSHVS